jgi:hypothetical protein
MARPKPRIQHSKSFDDGTTWHILAADAMYILTYKGQPFNMVTQSLWAEQPRKYKKTAYANEGSARARARELNELFSTEEFNYINIGT